MRKIDLALRVIDLQQDVLQKNRYLADYVPKSEFDALQNVVQALSIRVIELEKKLK